jgi:hypothetical protein
LSRHTPLYLRLCDIPGEQLAFLVNQVVDRRLPLQR